MPSDYQSPRVFEIADADADAPHGDILGATLQIDPTLGQVFIYSVVSSFGPEDDSIIFGLGDLDAAGACHPTLELVGGTQTYSWIARAVGETTLPPHTTDYLTPQVVVDPRLVGSSTTCVTERTITAAGGLPVDDAAPDLQVALVPVVQRDLALFDPPSLLQAEPSDGFDIHFAFSDPLVRLPGSNTDLRNPLYDVDIALTPSAGLSLDITHITSHPGADAYSPATIAHGEVTHGGWYWVDVAVTAGNGDPWHARLYLWALGGPHLAGTSDLTGRGAFSHYQAVNDHGDLSPGNAELWFVNRRFATRTPGHAGLPACSHASRSCLRYWYDASSGLLQVDKWRGFVTRSLVRLPAYTSADADIDMGNWGALTFFDGDYEHRMRPSHAGATFPSGKFRYREGAKGISFRFASGHRFTKKTSYGNTVQRVVRGTYRVGARHVSFSPHGGRPWTDFLAIGAKGKNWRLDPAHAGLQIGKFWYDPA
jgi:hypothetical protein